MSESKKSGSGILVNLVVAAVSVVITLTVTHLMAPQATDLPDSTTNSPIETTDGAPSGETTIPLETGDTDLEAYIQELEEENETLQQKVTEQEQQINELKNNIAALSASISNPDANTGVGDILGQEYADKQTQAYDLFTRIQAAYTDFDRDTLEALCPQLNELVEYLSADARQSYYLILEYMEQPSND